MCENENEKERNTLSSIIKVHADFQFSLYASITLSPSLLLPKMLDPNTEPLRVTHYHFTSWPDHGVPKFATSLISFIKRVQKSHNKDSGCALLVHCRAGIGRSGTFILLDAMLERMRVENTVNVYAFLQEMRLNRMSMVQTLVSGR